jgi:hypothetical protein
MAGHHPLWLEPALAHHFDLVSHWRLSAPVERVWAALADAESWPVWWPCVVSVRVLRAGNADGLGSVRLFRWHTRLLCDIKVEVERVECLRPERLRGRSGGPLGGTGIWLLRAEGAGTRAGFTDVTCVWRVDLAQRWMRWCLPLLAPVLRWNHSGVMRAGAHGLARYLAQQQEGEPAQSLRR